MARWLVVTEGLNVPVDRVVPVVLGCEELADGRVQWLVEGTDCILALPSCFKGFLVVEPVDEETTAVGCLCDD